MRIVIEAMHGLGDMVCILPMIRFVRDKYPDAEITVITKFARKAEIYNVHVINNEFRSARCRFLNIKILLGGLVLKNYDVK